MRLIISIKSIIKKPINRILKPILTKQDEILKKQKELLSTIKATSLHNELRFYSLYKKPNENILDTKKRFFRNLPPINNYMKLKHDGNYILLKYLSLICESNNINYSICGGALLGAIRSKTFVQWDDDVDIYISLSEYEKLARIIELDNYVKIINWYIPNEPFRIHKLVFKNDSSTWYIDLFVFTNFNINLDKLKIIENNFKNDLRNKIKDLEKKFRINLPYSFFDNYNNEFVKCLNQLFDMSATEYSKLVFDPKKETNGLTRLIEIPFDGPMYILKNDFYPLRNIKLYDLNLKCLNNIDNYLFKQYGDIFQMPIDIIEHMHDKSNLNDELIAKKNTFLQNITIKIFK